MGRSKNVLAWWVQNHTNNNTVKDVKANGALINAAAEEGTLNEIKKSGNATIQVAKVVLSKKRRGVNKDLMTFFEEVLANNSKANAAKSNKTDNKVSARPYRAEY
jgi:hypothetical protein